MHVYSNSSGDHKLKLFVIGKYKNRGHLITSLTSVIYKAHFSAWMNEEFFSNWFFHGFVLAIKINCAKLEMPKDIRQFNFRQL